MCKYIYILKNRGRKFITFFSSFYEHLTVLKLNVNSFKSYIKPFIGWPTYFSILISQYYFSDCVSQHQCTSFSCLSEPCSLSTALSLPALVPEPTTPFSSHLPHHLANHFSSLSSLVKKSQDKDQKILSWAHNTQYSFMPPSCHHTSIGWGGRAQHTHHYAPSFWSSADTQ